MDFFSNIPDNKRRRLLDSLDLTDTGLGVPREDKSDDGGDDSKRQPMGYEELVDLEYTECFACENVHAKAIEQNENYNFMMKLYTTNSANVCKDAIFKKIHEFFKEHIVPDIVDIRNTMQEQGDLQGLNDLPVPEWPVESIKAHFETHTNYPTDELLFQIRLKKCIRNKLSNNLIDKKEDGTLSFNHKNLEAMNKIDAAIIALMRTKKDINTMAGFSRELDY